MTTPYNSTPDPAFEAGVKEFAWLPWVIPEGAGPVNSVSLQLIFSFALSACC
jgi:hypothetical protein